MTLTLALETSCDDTCASLVQDGSQVLSNVASSQDAIHEKYQGIVPELASRRHCEVINGVIRESLDRANSSFQDLDRVAVTYGPGLIGSLLTGIAAAKSVHARFDCPLIPVNHIEAHAYSIELEQDLSYPYLSLVASGGHTVLFQVQNEREYRVLGHTRDDAVGEAYDKVAKMLDLGYPGGPEIQRTAEDGEPTIDFPRPTLRGETRWGWSMEDFDFSFSGVKTAVFYYLRDHETVSPADVAASFQQAVNDVLVHKTIEASRDLDCERIAVGGGVAANGPLRACFRERAEKEGRSVYFPSVEYCTDNAAMIGYRAQYVDERADLSLNGQPRLSDFTNKTAAGEKITE
jgi:N6-L-threonylcarbamoyladenine synthase